jgi:hypothetical protein
MIGNPAETKGLTMRIEDAIACLKANGYRVSKPRAVKTRPALNALGKPYSPQFDPNYRMKYRTPSLKRGGNIDSAIDPHQWTAMCAKAKEQWEHSLATGEPLPYHMGK